MFASSAGEGSTPTTPRPGTPLSRLEERDPALTSDPKYRRYAQQVDKCLATFETINEWADFISFLTKLLKTFQSFMQFKEIPRKLTVAKRLAQCLNPALPSGVHQRALDVYAHILAVLGHDGLARDLQIWSSGLFPFFQSAATSVRPTLLNIYDTHYLPLQGRLRPVMKAFILALLPGLEEETSEFFDKVLNLLDRLSGTVSPAFFLQNLWLVLLTTPNARSSAINYLSRRLPKLTADEDITPIVGNDLGLMVRAFAASLEDDNLLVRRGIMDILVQSLPVDSLALKKCAPVDRVMLMRATVSVVLRRDLSLNRRLYAWLLGPSETSEAQVAYFCRGALGLLEETLKSDMRDSVTGERETRPYKIFISLLDKSEIGIPLTERLCLDALSGLKNAIESDKGEDSDVLLTANTLYEAMEPSIVWARLFQAAMEDVGANRQACPAIDMLQFILSTFHVRDEEIEQVHLPLFFAAAGQLARILAESEEPNEYLAVTRSLLTLAAALLDEMPKETLFVWPKTTSTPANNATSALSKAYTTYSYAGMPEARPSLIASSPFKSAFQDLLFLSQSYAEKLVQHPGMRDNIGAAISLLQHMTDILQTDSLSIDWQPSLWFQALFDAFAQSSTFYLVDGLVTLSVTLAKSNIMPELELDSRPCVVSIVTQLLHYLEVHRAPCHTRASELIWAVDSIAGHHHVEAVICQGLTAGTIEQRSEMYEAFGILWRLTDDSRMPGFRLKAPMLLVLDGLKSEDPHFRRIAETWMRCSLKSYHRILDPVLHDLMAPAYSGMPRVFSYQGVQVQEFEYERLTDQTRILYLLENLLSLVRFGGQGFGKSVKTSALPGFLASESSQARRKATNYLDLLIDVLTRFLQSEPSPPLKRAMTPTNTRIQSTAIDILQLIVSRGEIEKASLLSLQQNVVSKLYSSIHTARLDLQNKLLHILHSIILATAPLLRGSPSPSKVTETPIEDKDKDKGPTSDKLLALLIQTLLDGVSRASNRPILQHWIDFVLMTIPQFLDSMQLLVVPLCQCVSQQLRNALHDIHRATTKDVKGKGNLSTTTNDAEFVILLNALERLVLMSLSRASDVRTSEDEVGERTGEGGGLLGYVSGVFGADSSGSNSDESLSARSPGYRSLHDAVRVLFTASTMQVWQGSEDRATFTALDSVYSRTKSRSRKVLERLWKAQPTEVFESIIELWHRDTEPTLGRDTINSITFEMVDSLTSSAQTVVHMVCESALARTPVQADRPKKYAMNPYLSDATLLAFLEEYFSKLEGPIAVQVWARTLSLAKDVTTNMHGYRQQVFPVLRCLTVLAERLAQSTALDEKRMRRDFLDVYVKLLDNCVLIAGRSFEQGNWMRRSTLSVDGLGKTQSELSLAEKPDTPSPLDSARSVSGNDFVSQIEQFLAKRILPNLRRFLNDPDRIGGVCSNIGYYLTTPALKAKAGSLDVPDITLLLLTELSKIPAAAKAWRPAVGEIFADSRFFTSKPESGIRWKVLIGSLMESDKDRLLEIIRQVGLAPSATIFTSKDMESLLRCMTIRRMTYILFCGERDQFHMQLPGMQEKVVEILRGSNNPPSVHAEIYLCMRAILCRFSPNNISTFWPIILAELVRLFEDVILEPPADNSDDLAVLLAACKFLDLLLVLQTEEFQIHQWMFVTDTVDAIYRPDGWQPQSLIDQLAEVVCNLPAHKRGVNGKDDTNGKRSGTTSEPVFSASPIFRKPMLQNIEKIVSIRDLQPFFSHVSIASYESVYANSVVDWESLERDLAWEMFEGR
ncbi:hypothetical protein DACRYDRAFT_94483 [Dacryopinax primogenitus]|uniref:Uncharacterized protein n=1 Tax=Dacryopinax primogenitus (strain DJM 731) TaxID=1858805 RepID=M5G3K6_DACPD|nr:uncharacterized protein DACRYDRAFT_94483 [Dacryopinax primogenitus]EJU02805.1 hypothetical protein DACRYDRAFT_94483 [Dacryopinax primogenitus]